MSLKTISKFRLNQKLKCLCESFKIDEQEFCIFASFESNLITQIFILNEEYLELDNIPYFAHVQISKQTSNMIIDLVNNDLNLNLKQIIFEKIKEFL